MLKRFDNSCQQQQFQTLLKAEQLNDDIKKVSRVVFSANTIVTSPTDNEINAIDDLIDDEEDIVNTQDYMEDDGGSQISVNLQHNSNLTLEQYFSSAKTGSKI